MTGPQPEVIQVEGADGLMLSGDISGPPDGPFVLMTHGGGQTRHSWRDTAKVLAGQGYRVLSLDMRGHGDSAWSPDADYRFQRYAADVEAVVRTMARGPAALVGASMGGLASLMASKPLGERVGALVLVDVATRIAPEGVQRIGGFMRRHVDGFATLEEAADAVAEYRPGRPRPKSNTGLMKNLRLRPDGRYHWHWDPAMLRRGGDVDQVIRTDLLDEAAGAIKAPVLLVHGVMSDIVDEAGIDTLRASIPQLEVAHVSGAGHMVVGDNNAVFEEVIVRFLNRVFQPVGA
ncbi:alpha/beta hydrolase [Phenylobacterium sp.]|jgi:pimeloyl-ACP methyl ester carboxylesterase|uniref:alpha/beta fold hydrolase n=1 Tax=Phenylobacterium sp. TaxID=1871053 RepID=UPI002F405E54